MLEFRPDVRLWAEDERAGFQRGLEIAWLERKAAELLWRDGPLALGGEIAASLQALGLLQKPSASEGDIDRSAVFADAVCDGWNQPPLEQLKRAQFVILGCGGLGSNLAIQLASLGAVDLILVDGDYVERSNLNRLVWCGEEQVGRSKVMVLAEHLSARFGAHSQVIDTMVSAASAASAIARVDHRRPCVIFLTIDSPLDAREALGSILQGYALSLRDFLPIFHAGYAGRFCVAGPAMLSEQDPCPFCGEPERQTIAGRPFVAPSAAPNNLAIASFLATQTLRHLAENELTLRGQRWCLDLATGCSTIRKIAKDPQCPICSPQLN